MPLLIQIFITQGLFFDLFNHKKSQNISKRKGVSYSSYNSNHNSYKKKSDYVCSSDKYSLSVKQSYNCDTSKTQISSGAITSFSSKNSQPCYDDNK